ncbi:MAG: response regulator [Opitutaceae bacterium]|nr:response regulator [Opitutaceae bacterium]
MIARWTPSLPRPLPLLLTLAAAAALNCVEIELIGGVHVVLGSFLYLPFVLLLPVPWAVAAAGVAMAPTVFSLGQPFALILGMAEAGALAWGLRRKWGAAPLIDVGFWVTAGLGLSVWMYSGVARLPADLATLEVLVRVVNQLLAVIVADFLVRHTRVGGLLRTLPQPANRLRDVVFNYVFVLAAVPVALVAAGLALLLQSNVAREDRSVLLDGTRQVARELRLFLDLHQAAVISAAGLIQPGTSDASQVLEQIRSAHPAFVTMLATDPNGRILNTAPLQPENRLRGSDVSDREYFRLPKVQNKPFVSGVFRGRGFGADLLIAISAPLTGPGGEFLGVVQGSLKIDEFVKLMAESRVSSGLQWILADSSGHIIFASPGAGMKTLDELPQYDLGKILLNRPDRPFVYDLMVDGASERMRAYVTRNAEYRFLVIAQRPVLAAAASSLGLYGMMAAIVFGVLATAAFVARLSNRRLSGPLEEFARATGRQAESGTVEVVPPPKDRVPSEVSQIYAAFNALASRLHATYDELRRNNELLDQRVGERTRELEQARREAVAASESKTAFLSVTSHEIRGPLHAIVTEADLIQARVRDPEIRAQVDTIRLGARSLVGIVNNLIDLSKIESGKLELKMAAVEIGSLCREVVSQHSERAAARGLALTLESSLQAELWVETDGARLRQVLGNLVGNAVRFTEKGTVWLCVEAQGAGPVEVRFRIVDTGPGIPKAMQDDLFDPLAGMESSRPADSGSGLSLAISRRLVECLGSKIVLHSVEGRGTEFAFLLSLRRAVPGSILAPAPLVAAPLSLPVASSVSAVRAENTSGITPGLAAGAALPARSAKGEAEPRSVTPVAASAVGVRTLKEVDVLVADDTVANQEVMLALLEGRCRSVVVVSSAQEAMDRLRTGVFAVALIDLQMPDIDGFQVASTVRSWAGDEASRGCRLLAVSAHPAEEMRTECLRVGFDDYVEKPINRKVLFEALRACLAAAGESAPA